MNAYEKLKVVLAFIALAYLVYQVTNRNQNK